MHMCVFVWRAEARLGVLWQLLPVLVDEEKLPLDLKRLMNKLQDAECLVGVSRLLIGALPWPEWGAVCLHPESVVEARWGCLEKGQELGGGDGARRIPPQLLACLTSVLGTCQARDFRGEGAPKR